MITCQLSRLVSVPCYWSILPAVSWHAETPYLAMLQMSSSGKKTSDFVYPSMQHLRQGYVSTEHLKGAEKGIYLLNAAAGQHHAKVGLGVEGGVLQVHALGLRHKDGEAQACASALNITIAYLCAVFMSGCLVLATSRFRRITMKCRGALIVLATTDSLVLP